MKKQNYILIMLFLVLCSAAISEPLEEKLKNIQLKEQSQNKLKKRTLDELIQLGSEIEFQKDKEKTTGAEIKKIELEIIEKNQILDLTQTKISVIDGEINTIQQNISHTESALNQRKQYFLKRLRAIYKEQQKISSAKVLEIIPIASITVQNVKFTQAIAYRDRIVMDNISEIKKKLNYEKKKS